MDGDRRYTDLIADWVEQTLRAHGTDLDVMYEAIMTFVATPNGPTFVCQLVMTTPSPILGQTIIQIDQFSAAGLDALVIEEKTRGMCEKLRAEWTRQLGLT